jgi:hypothetical protein
VSAALNELPGLKPCFILMARLSIPCTDGSRRLKTVCFFRSLPQSVSKTTSITDRTVISSSLPPLLFAQDRLFGGIERSLLLFNNEATPSFGVQADEAWKDRPRSLPHLTTNDMPQPPKSPLDWFVMSWFCLIHRRQRPYALLTVASTAPE